MQTKQQSTQRQGPFARRTRGLVAAWSARPLFGYATGVLLTAAALGLTMLAREWLERSVFVLFFAAITATAWLGGLGPALVATLLSVVSVDYFLLERRLGLGSAPVSGVVVLVVCSLVSVLIAWLSESARRSAQRAARQTEELEHSREFLEQAQRSAQLGSWEWDILTNHVSWSDEMFRAYGREPGSVDVSYETFLALVHPDDREMVRGSVERAYQTGEPFAFDHRVIWPDGTARWLHGRGRVVRDADGKPMRMVGSGQDVTDRRRAAEAQRLLAEASEALTSLDYAAGLRTVANLAAQSLADWCAVVVGDESGRYEYIAVEHRDPERARWAADYLRLHPPRFDALMGVPNVLRTGRPELYAEITPELLAAGAQSEDQHRVAAELRIRSAMIVPMLARGRTLGTIVFVADKSRNPFTTDDLELAERLAGRAALAIDNARLFEDAQLARRDAEAANRAKMDFLAMMSHELRTPLNAIGGYTELLQMGIHGPLSDAQHEVLNRMSRSQRHLLSLVEELLGFAKVEAGRIAYDIAEVPVHAALVRVGDSIGPQALARNIRYEYDGCDATLSVRADRERLEQIVLNLLTNAIKFTSAGGRVMLRVGTRTDIVEISVADTGIGIPAEKLDMVFEPFVQLPQGLERRAGGIGLGLAISRDLARAMGGDISIQSAPGRGSTFILRLPRAGTGAAAANAARNLPPPPDTVPQQVARE